MANTALSAGTSRGRSIQHRQGTQGERRGKPYAGEPHVRFEEGAAGPCASHGGLGSTQPNRGATDADGGGEVLEPPRPQGAETISRGPGFGGSASRANRQVAVTPRSEPRGLALPCPDCRRRRSGAHDLGASHL